MWNWQSQLLGGGSGTGGRVSRTHLGAGRAFRAATSCGLAIATYGRMVDTTADPLARERIRSELKFHHLRQGTQAAFEMERRAVAGGGPDAPAFPAGIGIIDAAVHALGEKAHRVRHAHLDELAIHQRVERI